MRAIAILCLLVLASLSAQAQCDGCTPDLTCSVEPAYPTLCPASPPNATAGEPYSADITFWLPDNFTDPGSGFNVDFLLMTITSVSGLPYGMNIGYSEPSGIYHPQENSYGCSRICGTPVGAGSYVVTINIIAQVEYNGFTLNVPQQFTLPLTVLPGTGGNTGFTFTPTSGCGARDVEFTALIDGQGAPVSYLWDLGDGNTSDQVTVTQTYEEPGIHTIALQTTIGGYVLNGVSVSGVNDNWCGDVEEISLFGSCQGSPDIYFVLTDGLGNTYESSHGEDSGSEDWSGLGLALSIPPYAIEFWDEDPVSVDDALGTYNIPQNGEGTYNFNVAGGTFGSLTIDLMPQQIFNDTDTVVVFAAPDPIITFDEGANTLCVDAPDATIITWFNDGDTVFTGSATCWEADSTGAWWAVATNGFGCATASDTMVVCPTISITQSGEVLFTGIGLADYQWYLNGGLIPGANAPFILAESSGEYGVVAHDALGCELAASYTFIITDVSVRMNQHQLVVFPSPAVDQFTVALDRAGLLEVFSATGELVRTMSLRTVVRGGRSVDVSDWANGPYLLRIMTHDSEVRYGRVEVVH